MQDSVAWVARGLVDIIHPQIYRHNFFDYNREVKQIIKTYDRNSWSKFAPGIAFTANGKDVTAKDLIKYLQTNSDRSFSGQVFFHYEGLRKNNAAMAIAIGEVAGRDGESITDTASHNGEMRSGRYLSSVTLGKRTVKLIPTINQIF